ncbi:MAG TPA: peptidylprolyl isomerase, partial [Balneolaceae bacterium]|nr:peptidylprolyl isomerase [Balneolaceae bacterium]
HAVFGEVTSDEEQEIVDSISQGDEIESINIEGEYEELLKKMDEVQYWNETLDEQFENLKPAAV